MSDKATLREPLLSTATTQDDTEPRDVPQGSRGPELNGGYGGLDEKYYYGGYGIEEESLESKRNTDGPFYCCCCFSCKRFF